MENIDVKLIYCKELTGFSFKKKVFCISQDYFQGANRHEDNGFVIAKELKFKKLKYLTKDC